MPFKRRLLHRARLCLFQLNSNIQREIFCCLMLQQEWFHIDPSHEKIQACFEIQLVPRYASFYYIYLHRKRFFSGLSEVTGWQSDWLFIRGDWEPEVEGVPSIPRSFSRHNHILCSSASPLDQASSSKVNEIFSLDLAERDAKVLLKKGCLRNCLGFRKETFGLGFICLTLVCG